ncbi:MAG: phosphoglucosamine mutase [delta proteobacterium ML8_F1]|nr:MAG: phosphoglucosamine mutase [delta proteobacterium ML8_F1]
MGKLFGTDGVRGIANEELTNQLAYNLGFFGARVLTHRLEGKKARILVGKDTRLSGDMLENALIAGILASGSDVVKAGVIPTPGVAFLVRKEGYDAGIMISASHNSFEYNGIKFFNGEGLKLSDEVENAIEELILGEKNEMKPVVGEALGRLYEDSQVKYQYLDHIKRIAHADYSSLEFAIDVANGAVFELAPQLFDSLGAKVHVLNHQPDGININAACGSTYMGGLREYVITHHLDFGLAFDGDADRLLAVDHTGNLVDGDKIMMILANQMKAQNKLVKNAVVVTVMSNIGFHKAMMESEVDVEVTRVGDRYVLEKMLEKEYTIGGEQSGHIIFLEHNTTGDGLLTGVKLINAIIDSGSTLKALAEKMKTFPQVLKNARIHPENMKTYNQHRAINQRIREIEDQMKGSGRILIRPSGTEPLIRVMLEGEDLEQLNQYASELVELFEEQLKK